VLLVLVVSAVYPWPLVGAVDQLVSGLRAVGTTHQPSLPQGT